jgi:hypothetical protein
MDGPTYISIEQRAELTAERFAEDYLRPQLPVIIKGGTREWPAAQNWSPQWFADHYPDVKIPIAIGPRRAIAKFEIMPLRDFVHAMQTSSEHMYLRQFDLFRLLPELRTAAPNPALCPSDRDIVRNFWMGANTLQPLHYDAHWRIIGTCNLFAQIYGKKRVILASPQQTPFLYERRGESTDYHLSEVDIEAPDLRRFPLVRKATLWTGEVEGGDLLFVPLNYWHFMQSFGASISVSFWWHPHAASYLAHRLRVLASEDPRKALQFAYEHEGAISLADVKGLGGIDELRQGLQAIPERLRQIVPVIFDKEVRAALQSPVTRWYEK